VECGVRTRGKARVHGNVGYENKSIKMKHTKINKERVKKIGSKDTFVEDFPGM
jgi:hypothetical protein